jgi:hypothetical protein
VPAHCSFVYLNLTVPSCPRLLRLSNLEKDKKRIICPWMQRKTDPMTPFLQIAPKSLKKTRRRSVESGKASLSTRTRRKKRLRMMKMRGGGSVKDVKSIIIGEVCPIVFVKGESLTYACLFGSPR